MRLKGYITVEASMVVPLSVLVIMTMLYLCFYLHDNVIINSYSYVLCFHQDSEDESSELRKKIRRSLIVSELKEIDRKKHKYNITTGVSILTDLKAIVHIREYNRSDVKLTGTDKREQIWMIHFLKGDRE